MMQNFWRRQMLRLTERLTEHKYKGSYEQIAKAIQQFSSVPKLDMVNYWEQVVFSWITGDADMPPDAVIFALVILQK